MSTDRRAGAESRRRRVLYQSNNDITTDSPAERRAAEKLREARRPTANYASHVNRRLRGRWYSLVPVRRRAMIVCATVVLGTAFLLTVMHWATETWPILVDNPELARPLRLDRYDSLGTWAKTFFLASTALTALLVYQLRRYKVDDYKGNYRIWRPVILLIAILSIDSVCDLVPWFGAMIDAALGKRVAFSGADWIRIVLTVGGGALALRMVAEVRKSKIALVMMLLAIVGFATPLSSRWGLFDATKMPGWLAVASAPLVAAAALWVSVGGYLRMLFREVRGLNEAKRESSIEQSLKEQSTALESKPARERRVAQASSTVKEPKRGWFGRRVGSSDAKPIEATKPALVPKPVVAQKPIEPPKPIELPKPIVPAKPEPKLATTAPAVQPKRSWFSRKATNPDDKTGAAPKPVVSATKPLPAKPTPATAEAKPARKGLGSWLRRDSSPAAPTNDKPKTATATNPVARNAANDSQDDDDEADDGSVDWGAMNKSERRRMRKEIKRGGRAA